MDQLRKIQYKVAFVSGACRSGKTLFCKLLGSCNKVEWIEEPYWLRSLLWMKAANDSHIEMLDKYFIANMEEMILEHVLLRHFSNLRTKDYSSIWNYKPADEILNRIVNINDRENAYKIAESTWFLVDIPEVLPYVMDLTKFFKEAIVIHVVRNPQGVAYDVAQKGWHDKDTLIDGDSNVFYKKNRFQQFLIPIWVKDGDENRFLSCDSYQRELYYWRQMVALNMDDEKKILNQSHHLVHYEDIILKTEDVIENFMSIFETKRTSLTNAIKSEFNMEHLNIRIQSSIDSDIERIMHIYGY